MDTVTQSDSDNQFLSNLFQSTSPSDSAQNYIKCRRDINLVRRAIKSRWPISDETRRQIIERLKIISAESEDERSAVAASRALIAADTLNLADEKFQSEEARLESGEPTKRVDHTTGGKPLAGGLSLTSDDLKAVAGILGVGIGAGLGLAEGGGNILPDNRPQPVDTAHAPPAAKAIPAPG